MNRPRLARNRETAFALRELLVTVASVATVLLLICLGATACNRTALRIHCTAGLKQLAQGLALWADDHQGRFPMEVPVSAGGSREEALAGRLVPTVVVASNQLYPSFFICPADQGRRQATNFVAFTTTNISYFLNPDAAYTNSPQIIAGDRDIMVNGSIAPPGLVSVTNSVAIGWASLIHRGGGNVALIDGSAHQVTTKGLRDLLSPRATNHILVP